MFYASNIVACIQSVEKYSFYVAHQIILCLYLVFIVQNEIECTTTLNTNINYLPTLNLKHNIFDSMYNR